MTTAPKETAQLASQEAALPRFLTMLRKRWSGCEVSQWIDDNIRLLLGAAGAPVDEVVPFGGNLKEVSWRNGKMPPAGRLAVAAAFLRMDMKIKTTSRKVSNLSAGRMGENSDGSPDGVVVTEHGYVLACSRDDWLSLSFVWRGREYRREIDRLGRHWTTQGIVQPAKEFAAEIAGG